MSKEEKKKYLNSYLLQEAKIKRLREMCRIHPERRAEYEKLIDEASALRDKIEGEIKAVGDDLSVELLYQKYIFGKTLEEISLILNYSKRHIERLHIKALKKFGN